MTVELKEAGQRSIRRDKILGFVRGYGQIGILVALTLVLGVITPSLLSEQNLVNLARQGSIIALVAAGVALVILTANIDLSVGGVLALSGMVAAGLARDGVPIPLAICGAVAVGAVVGALNGVLVAVFGLASFVVTLATMSITTGATLLYSSAKPIAVDDPFLLRLGQGRFLGLPLIIWIALGLFAVLTLVMKFTRFGRYVYAIGGNEEAAKLAGVPVVRYKIAVFTLAGVLASVAGILIAARLGSAVPTAGTGQELTAITAVVLGGMSLFGGEGRIWGVLVGAGLLALIGNALNLLNVDPFFQDIATGTIVILAILFDRYLRVARGT